MSLDISFPTVLYSGSNCLGGEKLGINQTSRIANPDAVLPVANGNRIRLDGNCN